jgi:hypothetical protein
MITIERKKAVFEPIKMTINSPKDLGVLRAILTCASNRAGGSVVCDFAQGMLESLPEK